MSAVNITLLAATQNHALYAGNTFSSQITLKEDGTEIDISADTFNFNVVDNRGAAVAELIIGSGIEFGSTGVLIVRVEGADTADWPTNCDLQYELIWTRDSDGLKKTIQVGSITVTPSLI